MIVIIGDSWSCGEWDEYSQSITHTGLQQYLLDCQYPVINLGRGGDSNFGSYLRLRDFLKSGILQYIEKITHVLYFQTEWHRDYKPYYNISNNQQNTWDFPKTTNSLQESNDLATQTICNWQYRLVDLAQQYKFQIGLIGGASDTIWIDNFAQEYPGLKILCQSMTNLCINNTHRIDKPIYHVNGHLIDVIKNSLKDIKDTEELLSDMDSILFRRHQWRTNEKYFWPDGLHANRLGHKKLFDFIMESEFLKIKHEL
jgi:hypothetical protein